MSPLHDDEVHVDEATVRALLSAQFGRWADLPIAEVPGGGTVNRVYRLGDELCVRLPRTERYAAELERELTWLPVLAPRLPLAVPVPVARGEPADAYPLPWAVYRWLEGEPMIGRQDQTDARIEDMELAEALAGFVRALRAIELQPDAPGARRSVPLKKLDRMTRAALGSLPAAVDRPAVTAVWEACLAAPPWDGDPVWTHGDLLPTNILTDRGRLSGIIDFGSVGAGDPAVDLIPAWSVLDAEPRRVYRDQLEVDDAAWARGRGIALQQALLIIPYYPQTYPAFVTMARRTVARILADPGG